MIENLGISPNSILAMSFTNKAAGEMRERMGHLLGSKKSAGLTLATFHSLGVRILREEITKLGYRPQFSIYDTADQLAIIKDALKHYEADKKFDRKEIQSKISLLKNKGLTCEEFSKSKFFDYDNPYDLATEYCFRYYQDKLKFFNAIDFDDILYLNLKLFDQFPEVAKKYSEKFQFIMVDEYQDTNPLQFKLISHLTSTHQNICVVGDDDQSIYAFRGADISLILGFENQFKEAKIIKLEENYRSTKPILDLANAVIKQNKKRKEKSLRTKQQSTELPLLWAMGDSDHEAEVVAEEIRTLKERGHQLSEVAILYRSKTQAPAIEETLRMNQIPYKMLGGQKFYEKKEVKDLMGYLMCIYNPQDEVSLRRIMNVPRRGIGNSSVEKATESANLNKSSFHHALKNMPEHQAIQDFLALILKYQQVFKEYSLAEAMSKLIEEISYMSYIQGEYQQNPKQAEARKKDVLMFVESMDRFCRYYKEKADLRTFIEKVLLADSQDNESDKENKVDEVTMMTLHSSKGLEFNQVFLLGMEEELLPHKKTITMGEDISEECRLAYVGITRARKKLIMTFCKEREFYGKKIPRHKSRFLTELKGQELFIEQDRTAFGHLSKEEAELYKKDFFKGLMNLCDLE
jgi:DNA helicase II / ATP-dependent DNA helicase PcrA